MPITFDFSILVSSFSLQFPHSLYTTSRKGERKKIIRKKQKRGSIKQTSKESSHAWATFASKTSLDSCEEIFSL
jgi:hypothetical protein